MVARTPRPSPAIDASLLSDLVLAALLDFNVAAIDEDARHVHFHTDRDRDAALTALPARFPELAFTAVDVPDEDWAARSQAGLRAIQVGDIIVAPPWDLPPEGGRCTITIQPSMGFGTGHHATTRLCLAALQALDLRGKRVLDVGTGSGVLAIAASRLGAAAVVGIDDDPDAIASATENVHLNEGANVQLETADLRSASPEPGRRASLGQFDVVIANLTGGLLVQAAGALQAVTAPGGLLVLSGFMTHEEGNVLAAYDGFEARSRTAEDEWLCVTLSAGAALQCRGRP